MNYGYARVSKKRTYTLPVRQSVCRIAFLAAALHVRRHAARATLKEDATLNCIVVHAAQNGRCEDSIVMRPFLRKVATIKEKIDNTEFPFTIPAFSDGIDIEFEGAITLFVGENGSGKSTLLEAIAAKCGFNVEGGSRNHRFQTSAETTPLAEFLRLSWLPKVTDGFFLRAESFFNFASYIDQLNGATSKDRTPRGGKSLHAQSHGESFLSLFMDRFKNGLYILDEPEAALSPQRQLSFMRIMYDLEKSGQAQFLIATHSPMILAYPGATVLSLDGAHIHPIPYQETGHYQLLKQFLDSPERYFRHLFSD